MNGFSLLPAVIPSGQPPIGGFEGILSGSSLVLAAVQLDPQTILAIIGATIYIASMLTGWLRKADGGNQARPGAPRPAAGGAGGRPAAPAKSLDELMREMLESANRQAEAAKKQQVPVRDEAARPPGNRGNPPGKAAPPPPPPRPGQPNAKDRSRREKPNRQTSGQPNRQRPATPQHQERVSAEAPQLSGLHASSELSAAARQDLTGKAPTVTTSSSNIAGGPATSLTFGSVAATQVATLLRNPQGIAQGMLIAEILQPPLAHRRGRR